MPRKSITITTPLRYTYKMVRLHGGVPSPEMINELARMQYAAWEAGYGEYKEAYARIKSVLEDNNIPSGLWGLYKAFVNEYLNKVKQRRVLTEEELMNIWERKARLERHVMEAIIAKLKGEEPVEQTSPRSSGARPSGA